MKTVEKYKHYHYFQVFGELPHTVGMSGCKELMMLNILLNIDSSSR